MDRLPLKISSQKHLEILGRMAGVKNYKSASATLGHGGFQALTEKAGIKRNRLLSARSEHAQVTSVRAKEDYKRLQRAYKAMSPKERRQLGLLGDFKDIHQRTPEQIYKRAGIAKETLLKSEADERREQKTKEIIGKPGDRLGHGSQPDDRGLPSRIVPVRTRQAAIDHIGELKSNTNDSGEKSVLADSSLHSAADIPDKIEKSAASREPGIGQVKSRWQKEEAKPTVEKPPSDDKNIDKIDIGLPF